MSFSLLFERTAPKIEKEATRKEIDGWEQCFCCKKTIFSQELRENLSCCPECGFHARMSIEDRIDLLCDRGSFIEHFDTITSSDPLQFTDLIPYKTRLAKAYAQTKKNDAITTGIARCENIPFAIAIMDFSFMGGSMGCVVGEKLACIMELAADKEIGLVVITSSGGARMQESMFSLMQMAKTASARTLLQDKALPYITILTHPTTGGVTASFATLGDIILAEPQALVAFTGPRVIEQTIKQKLPENAQKSEFLLEKGMIDQIAPRKNQKKQVAFFLKALSKRISK